MHSEPTLNEAVAADDVESAAIAIATDEYPGLRPEHVRAALDEVAERLRPDVYAVAGHARLGRFLRGVYRELAFSTPDAYDDPRLHHLNCVLERRVGSPVALSVVLLGVGERLGVGLSGVAFPGHFMVRYEASEPVFIDPSSGAFPFPADCLRKLASEELRVPLAGADRFLLPVGARTFAVRLLQNLQRSYEERGDLGRALLVADRLYEVTGSPSARCDRGLRAALLGAPHGALDDLSAYLREHDDDDVAHTAARLQPTVLDLN
jgi:regulator of sirC expression with transglutaminase-like and TPR domain